MVGYKLETVFIKRRGMITNTRHYNILKGIKLKISSVQRKSVVLVLVQAAEETGWNTNANKESSLH